MFRFVWDFCCNLLGPQKYPKTILRVSLLGYLYMVNMFEPASGLTAEYDKPKCYPSDNNSKTNKNVESFALLLWWAGDRNVPVDWNV